MAPERRSQTFWLALAFEGGLGVIAAALAWSFGVPLLAQLPVDGPHVAWGVVATLPMLAGYWMLVGSRRPALRKIQHLVEWFARELFPHGSLWKIAIVSALAGLGEEALFRGVLQPLGTRWAGLVVGEQSAVIVGLVVASLLFGAAHCLSRLYFFLATLVGLYFGVLAIAFDSITPAVIAHGLYDFAVLVLLTRGLREREEDVGRVSDPP